MKNIKNLLQFILFTVLFSTNASAFENLGSVSTALGGAGVGAVDLVDGVFSNPAALPFYEQKSAALSFAKKSFRISLSDNGADALFPAALAYSQSDIDGFKNKTFYLAIAHTITSKIAFGVNAGFQEVKIPTDDNKYRQTVVDAGFSYRPNSWLSAGLVLKNKPLNDTDLDNSIDDRPTTALGIESKYRELVNIRLEAEAGKNAQDQQKSIFKTGVEIFMNEWMMLRLGYQNNNILSQNYFTAGLGFGGPQFGLHYAYVKESAFEKEIHHSIDLAVPF